MVPLYTRHFHQCQGLCGLDEVKYQELIISYKIVTLAEKLNYIKMKGKTQISFTRVCS
jgi:hypothetical protein